MRPRREAFLVAAVLVLIAATPAHAAFGVSSFTAEVRKADNSVETQAGAHPFVGITDFTFSGSESVRNIRVDLPPGLISNPQAVPTCGTEFPNCDPETQVGVEEITAFVLLPFATTKYK